MNDFELKYYNQIISKHFNNLTGYTIYKNNNHGYELIISYNINNKNLFTKICFLNQEEFLVKLGHTFKKMTKPQNNLPKIDIKELVNLYINKLLYLNKEVTIDIKYYRVVNIVRSILRSTKDPLKSHNFINNIKDIEKHYIESQRIQP